MIFWCRKCGLKLDRYHRCPMQRAEAASPPPRVYVDPLMPCIPSPQWPYRYSCHLVADTDHELHLFARRIGLRDAWFQRGRQGQTLPHYDLTPGRRKAAVAAGAVELTRRQMVERIMKMRAEAGP